MKYTLLIVGVAFGVATVFAAVVLAVVPKPEVVEAAEYPTQPDFHSQPDFHFSGAAIRLAEEGPLIISDLYHTPVGVKDAYVNPDCGCLTVERFEEDAVISTSVTPDETLAGLGIEVGLSGGSRISNIFFYKDGVKLELDDPDDYAQVAVPKANIWFLVISQRVAQP